MGSAAAPATGYVDLHVHYIPDVDDGVRTTSQGVELLHGLAQLGYARAVATPHIRTAMFDNDGDGLRAAFEAFTAQVADQPGLPELGLAAEHFCDDVFFELLAKDSALPYPGGRAALVEFPSDRVPLNLERRFFEMQLRGIRPLIAHPERYVPMFKRSDDLERLLQLGSLAQLDLMSLQGKYGRRPRGAAERMLEQDLYYVASSDCHDPRDLDTVAAAIERLHALVGSERATGLLAENPASILAGTVIA